MSGWIRLVHHWNQAVWGIPLLDHQKTMFFGRDLTMKFTIKRDIEPNVLVGIIFQSSRQWRSVAVQFFLDPSVIQLTKSPNNPELAIPTSFIIWSPHFLFMKRKGPKNQSYGPCFVECRFSEFSEHGNHPHLKKIFQVGFKKKTTYFHSYFSSPPVTTCYFSSPPSWFQSTFQKKGSPPVFQPSAPLQPAGSFCVPDHATGPRLGSQAEDVRLRGKHRCLLGWLVGGWT